MREKTEDCCLQAIFLVKYSTNNDTAHDLARDFASELFL